MEYIELNEENAEAANAIWEESIEADGLVYKPFKGIEPFLDFFLPKREQAYQKISILTKDGAGFASGCYVPGEERAYITYIGVRREYRRQGIGAGLLERLEELLLRNPAAGGSRDISRRNVNRTELVFFNPMNCGWRIPGGNGADHPNAPGIDVSTGAYLFFKNNGYRDYAMQNSYYLNLGAYQIPKEADAAQKQLLKEGITFEIYDPKRHEGLKSMMQGFDNPLWEREILSEVKKGTNSRPVLIVDDGGKTVGFTGPLDVEESGRGYFAGIGVSGDYRGRGIAKVLFCKLCVELKQMDASFMTLFTGELNPARNIYEAAGFRIVKTWADMRKEWK